MSSLSQAKTLGIVGSVLLLLGVIPAAGGIVAIIGLILVLIAVKSISDVTLDKSIFTNMIISVVLAIAGLGIGFLGVMAAIFSTFGLSGSMPFPPSDITSPSQIPELSALVPLIVSVVFGLVLIWITLTISAYFMRKSYNSIADHLNVGRFKTVGLLYLVGAASTIIMVGFIIIFVATIFQA
ncbi:MAG: DUF996 domain-containing protein, partial [Nitrososphaerales archaeon]